MKNMNLKRLSIVGGILMAMSAALAACGPGNNVVPVLQPGTAVVGSCANGPSFSPGGVYPGGTYASGAYPGGGYYGGGGYAGGAYAGGYNTSCNNMPGYTYYGGQCQCMSNYYNGGNVGGAYGSQCPVGHFMDSYGRCIYSSSGFNYGSCGPRQYFEAPYGCRYYY